MRSLRYKNKIWNFYKWILFLVMLDSLRVWFFWLVPIPFLTSMLFIVISAFVVAVSPQLFFFNRKTVFLFFFFYLMARFFGTRGNMNAYLGMFLTSVSIFFFLGLKDEYKIDFLSFFTKVFAILMAISLSAWILVMLGVDLPSFTDTYGFSERRNEAQYSYQNYYLFLIDFRFRDSIMLPRFNSVFLEPGYLSIILVILLYLQQFNMKNKYNIIMLVALFFTFSLAGWLLFMFVYIAHLLRNSRFKIRTIFFIIIGFALFFTFFSIYNDGDNLVNNYIFSRLKYDEETGTISGYNRTGEDFEIWYADYFLKSDKIFFGLDMKAIFGETVNVGWKVYFVNYGLIGLSFYLWFLLFGYLKFQNYANFVFLILYILIFIRGHHIIYFQAFPILFLGGLIALKQQGLSKTKYQPAANISQ